MNIFTKSRILFQKIFALFAFILGLSNLQAQLCLGYETRPDEAVADEVYLDVISQQFEGIVAFQFTLSFDPDLYEFVEYVSSGLPNFSHASFNSNPKGVAGTIAVVWLDVTTVGVTYTDKAPLFTLKMRKKTQADGIFEFVEEPTGIEIVFCEPQNGDCKTIYNFENCNTGENLAPAFKGQLFLDEDEDCTFDDNETNSSLTNGWAGWHLFAEQNGKYYGSANHDSDGTYELKLFRGKNNVEIILPSPYYAGCETQFTYDSEELDLNQVIKNPIQITEFCPFMGVQIYAYPAKACESTTYIIKFINNGTAVAEDAYLELNLDYRLQDISFTLGKEGAVTELGNNKFRIGIGDLNIGESGFYFVEALVPCDIDESEVLRSEARVFPNEICGEINNDWSGASVRVSGTCIDKEVVFEVENVGTGDMTEPLEYVVIEDAIIFRTEKLQLQKGAKEIITLNATGASYFMQMQQEKGHPGNYIPSAYVEACGKDLFSDYSTGYANRFPEENNDYFVDVEYQGFLTSNTPNRIIASPVGYSDEHFIEPNKSIEYTIFFNNPTSNLEIIDSLSEHLDISTFKPLAANQSYEYTLEENVLKMIIPPTSADNNINGGGFVKFSLKPKADLAIGTKIVNKAMLNFEESSVIEPTNIVFHTLMEDFLERSTSTTEKDFEEAQVSIYPNPSFNVVTFTVKDWKSEVYNLSIFNIDGKLIEHIAFNNPTFQFHKGALPGGTYLYRIVGESGQVENGLFVLMD